MKIFPAIDILDGKAVRLLHGDYNSVTVYGNDPVEVALKMRGEGAEYLHTVDLCGARDGSPSASGIIREIKKRTGLFVQCGGGVRSMASVDAYIDSGVDRVIIGSAALDDEEFLCSALQKYGDKIAVGADVRDGVISLHGWLEGTDVTVDGFFERMSALGVRTAVCTDISRDGAMRGANRKLYASLCEKYAIDLIASGGVSDLSDVRALSLLGTYGAIIGRAYYEGALSIKDAAEAARDN